MRACQVPETVLPIAPRAVCYEITSDEQGAIIGLARFLRPRSLARRWINSRCVRELDTAVTRAAGNLAAANRHRLPQPQPSSRTACPFARPARSQHSSACTQRIFCL